MATGGNGKDSFDALIARGLGMSITDSAGECPDDDVLTAFASRKLSAPEHGHWESHVAGCAKCLRAVAGFAKTGPLIDRAAQAATIEAISEDDESTYHAIRKSTNQVIESIRAATRFML